MDNKSLSDSQIKKLELSLGYKFKNRALLLEALTHPSLKHSKKSNKSAIKDCDYERMELLGDSIIAFVITETLFKNFSSYNEGRLAKVKAYLVSSEVLCKIAATLSLSEYILMTFGEENSGGRTNQNNIEDSLEAVIASIYLDSNINIVSAVIQKLWKQHLKVRDVSAFDPKSTLQELVQAHADVKPVYEVLNKSGEAHEPTFTVVVRARGSEAQGKGRSIKEAEKDAAQQLLQILKA